MKRRKTLKTLLQVRTQPCNTRPPIGTALQLQWLYKACFESVTASLPNKFPIGYWCCLINQVNLSVNIVRSCRRNPKLSAWVVCEGKFHFSSTPIAPPGTVMLMHKKTASRRSWGLSSKKNCMLGHASSTTVPSETFCHLLEEK